MREDSDYAGVLVPFLPPRLVFYSENPDELGGKPSESAVEAELQDRLQKRAGTLQRFLRELMALKDLHSNINIQVFLEYPEEVCLSLYAC